MDTIRHFKAQAKTLHASLEHDSDVRHRIVKVLRDSENICLQKVQHYVSLEAGFTNWNALLDASDFERRLAIVMAGHPLLNSFGIGNYSGDGSKPHEEKMSILAANRHKLRSNVDDVEWTEQWLRSNVIPTKTINRRHSSYFLKHIAEKHSPKGYLSNGVFIAAALIAGYPYKLTLPNPYFGMSEKSIKRLSL